MTTKEATDLVGILLLIIFVLLCVIWTFAVECSNRGRERAELQARIKRLEELNEAEFQSNQSQRRRYH